MGSGYNLIERNVEILDSWFTDVPDGFGPCKFLL